MNVLLPGKLAEVREIPFFNALRVQNTQGIWRSAFHFQTPCLLPLLHTLLKNQRLTISNPITSQSEAGSHFGFVLAMVAAARSPLCCAWEVSVLHESAGYQRGSECTEAARFSGEHLISSPASMGPSFSCRETEESLTWVDLLFLPQPPSALQAVRRGRGPVWEEAVVECSRCGFEGRKWLWKQQDTTRCEIQGHRK